MSKQCINFVPHEYWMKLAENFFLIELNIWSTETHFLAWKTACFCHFLFFWYFFQNEPRYGGQTNFFSPILKEIILLYSLCIPKKY